MKNSRVFRVVSLLMVLTCGVGAFAAPAEIWVSPTGDDVAAGTAEKPMKSPWLAVRKARDLRRTGDAAAMGEGVRILLKGGVYALEDTIRLRPEDAGTEKAPTVFEAAKGERPVLSGGVAVSGWRKADGVASEKFPETVRANLWEADVPFFQGRPVEMRQLWVNGRKAVLARAQNGEDMERLLEWDRVKETATVRAAALGGVTEAVRGLEMLILQQWEIAILRVKSVRVDGEKAVLTFHSPESRIQFEHPWPQPIMKEGNNAPFFLSGAAVFLDQPGEWWADEKAGKVYYAPREGERMESVDAVTPALETLVEIGGSLERPVTHVTFRGIEFAHGAWTRPGRAGHVPLQAGMAMTESYKLTPKGTPDWRSLDNQEWLSRMPASVVVRNAANVRFVRCRFERGAGTGLDYVKGTQGGAVEGCVFRDLGGSGLQLGSFQDEDEESHLPYTPEDKRVVCSGTRIANNLFTDCATEDWGCVGIAVGYAREIAIEHNELHNLPYTAVSVGWGWTRSANTSGKNRVVANRIFNIATRMADTGGIYTLSAQPGTLVAENAIWDVKPGPWSHDKAHWSYVYLDEGSAFMTVRDNWCPEEKFQKNANGPGNLWETNGPRVPEEIKSRSGLEAAFRDLRGDWMWPAFDHSCVTFRHRRV
ncbi:MAG: right-handed parallel beta-helix repeat-containing protein [Nibricoccus sp.]